MSWFEKIPKRGRLRLAVLIFLVYGAFRVCHYTRSGENSAGNADRVPVLTPEMQGEIKAGVLNHYDFYEAVPETFTVQIEDQYLRVQTTLDSQLEERLFALFKRYRPRLGAAVALDPATGKILAMGNYRHAADSHPELNPQEKKNLCLSSKFPAASLIKIVTANAAMEKSGFYPHHSLTVEGDFHTLYKKQLRNNKTTGRHAVPLRRAFALSINSYFGKLGIFWIGKSYFLESAEEFYFEKQIDFDLPVEKSTLQYPQNDYELAELACGYNQVTKISPLHAGLISAAIAHNGNILQPYLIEEVRTEDSERPIYQHEKVEIGHPIDPPHVALMQELMENTVKNGTARKSFSHLFKQRTSRQWKIGGKTGNLSVAELGGKCDWFTGYAIDAEGKKIAVSVLMVFGGIWTIHSSYIAAELMRFYLSSAKTS